ncbi:MAG: peptidase MA family metallohydrolase [Dermatophilaceae bacterium]
MTKGRRVAAIALCAGLVAAVAGQLSGSLDFRLGIGSVPQATHSARPGDDGTNRAASAVPTVDEQTARMAAAQDLLSARAVAVKTRNKSAWMATVDVPASAFRGRQSVVFDNLLKLPLGEFSYGTVQLAPPLDAARAQRVGPKAWVAKAPGTYSLAGYDRAPRSFEATYTLVQRSDGWRIADDTDSDGATAMQMWDLPRMSVLRGRPSLVIGNAPESRMRDYSATADSAVRQVTGVWGKDWNTHVVIVTPSTTEEFARLLQRSSDKGLDQVAAITQGVIDPGQRAQGDRVVINPKAFTALQPIGRRVVITHELTHVAARSSTTRPVPIWLSEGMADYVGYSGLDLSRARVAAELLVLVRQGKGPKALPTEADFDPARTRIAPSYSGSWLAVSRLVDLYGQARVVGFYRSIAGGLTVNQAVELDPDAIAAQAFPKSFGVTQAQFVTGWKHYLTTLARTR